MPAVSIIVPLYNVETYIERCIDSILAQTFTDFELILVDDGSTDKSVAICDDYLNRDGRIHVIHQRNAGIGAARNKGIDIALSNSSNQWICFIDSDDFITEDYLKILIELAEKYRVDCSIVGYVETYDSDLRKQRPDGKVYCLTPDDAFGEVFKGFNPVSMISAWGKLFKRELFGDMRFPNIKTYEDNAFTYKLLFKCDRLAINTTDAYKYYQNPDSIMHTKFFPEKLINLDILEEQLAFFSKNNFEKSFSRSAHDLCFRTANVEMDSMRLYPEYKVLYNQTRRRLRRYIHLYAKDCKLNIFKDPQVYHHTLPFISKVLCKLKSIITGRII